MPVCTAQFILFALTHEILFQRAYNIVSLDDQTFAHMVTIACPEGFCIDIGYLKVPKDPSTDMMLKV
jgi:hypothetical protein